MPTNRTKGLENTKRGSRDHPPIGSGTAISVRRLPVMPQVLLNLGGAEGIFVAAFAKFDPWGMFKGWVSVITGCLAGYFQKLPRSRWVYNSSIVNHDLFF